MGSKAKAGLQPRSLGIAMSHEGLPAACKRAAPGALASMARKPGWSCGPLA
ncbi:Hypothetical protein CAP_7472 [Chondromyces apiculatus DSM 436]|uniref:Uncharacterized protein n=1 Tax=Chondromyces apiculatus DSM 436 TaxID=1192034 RepID=A0A017SZF8_9BACT|nr:Hypothetical protein CAP_7472 [Chondromyces apiculatus DSM 436]